MYLGNLTKAEFASMISEQLKPFMEESAALRNEVADLKTELQSRNKELYTIEDLESIFSVSRATIHNWINEGKLIKHKIGGRTLFKREDVNRLIDLSIEKNKQ